MPPKVLDIVGHPRCGSTIFGNLLAEIPGVFHAGELCYLWTPGLPIPQQRCGCGLPVRECAVWRQVFAEAFEAPDRGAPEGADPAAPPAWGLPGIDVERMCRLQEAALAAAPAAEYLDAVRRLYRAIASVTGSSVVVDSSKLPGDAALVGRIYNLETTFVHLVREPYGAVYSRLPRKRADVPGSGGPPSLSRVVLESLRWVRSNRRAESVVKRSGRPWATVRYEDFVADPGDTLLSVAALMGLDPNSASAAGEVVLEINHTTGGNRNRWRWGPVAVEADRRWRQGLRPRDVTAFSWATWPYRLRHGYAS